MEAAWVLENIDRVGTIFCLFMAVLYFNKELHKLKEHHDKEFVEMRKEHREERERMGRDMNTALDKITLEMKAANDERAEIKTLLQSMKDFHTLIAHSLHDYDNVLNQIASKLDVNAKCDINREKTGYDNFRGQR